MDALFLGPALAASAILTLFAAKAVLQAFLLALERYGRETAERPQ